jgi:hypothetical protein
LYLSEIIQKLKPLKGITMLFTSYVNANRSQSKVALESESIYSGICKLGDAEKASFLNFSYTYIKTTKLPTHF